MPLSAFAHFGRGNTPLAVNHQNLYVASTISFNLAANVSLGEATAAIEDRMRELRVPASIRGGFQGTAAIFQQSLANEPYLIAAALLSVYIVLGILYESYVHPITILSTLPSAGAGAVLALIFTNTEFSIMALIGVILLIGIVKKNAILMIDFALDAERRLGLSSREAIYQACLKRFRPIIMTTMAAMLGALPLAVAFGEGAELRHPLGISIVGGLFVSQLLTLYTTPVIYLYLDRLRLWGQRRWRNSLSEPPVGHRPDIRRVTVGDPIRRASRIAGGGFRRRGSNMRLGISALGMHRGTGLSSAVGACARRLQGGRMENRRAARRDRPRRLVEDLR